MSINHYQIECILHFVRAHHTHTIFRNREREKCFFLARRLSTLSADDIPSDTEIAPFDWRDTLSYYAFDNMEHIFK